MIVGGVSWWDKFYPEFNPQIESLSIALFSIDSE